MKNFKLFFFLYCFTTINIYSQELDDPKRFSSISWVTFNMMTYDVLYGNTGKYNLPDRESGFNHRLEVSNFAIGFKEIGGLGLGTSIYEGWGAFSSGDEGSENKSFGTPSSFFPVYIHYPIFIKYSPDFYDYHNFYVTTQIGGSAWGVNNNKYLNFSIKGGYNYIFSTDGRPISGGFVLSFGLYHSFDSDYMIKGRTGYYVSLGLNLYGFIRKKE